MKEAINTPHRIDDYLQRIEERERASRRKKMMLAGLGAFALLAAGSLYFILGANKELRKYSIQELSKEIVTEIFDDSDSQIIVAHALGTDTIENLNEYQSLVDLFEGSDVQPAFFQGGSNEQSNDADASGDDYSAEILQKFSVDISGNRIAGNQLLFTIEDYDPEVEYTLSFGTGSKRKVGRVSRFTYRGSGTYRLRLLASSDDRGSSIYTKSIRISRAPVETRPTEREIITEATTTPAPSLIDEAPAAQDLEIVDGATRNINSIDEETTEVPSTTDENTTEEAQANNEVAEENTDNNESDTEANLTAPEAEKLLDTITEYSGPAPVEEKEAVAVDPNAPLFMADIMPEFPGGQAGLKRYFIKNYNYPRTARDKGVEGTVFVRFVVNADGRVSNLSVLKGLGFGCDDEAMRLIKNMPKWIPAEQDGKRVAVYKTMPIGFKLYNN